MKHIRNQTKQRKQTKYENALSYYLKIKIWNITKVYFRIYLQLRKNTNGRNVWKQNMFKTHLSIILSNNDYNYQYINVYYTT